MTVVLSGRYPVLNPAAGPRVSGYRGVSRFVSGVRRWLQEPHQEFRHSTAPGLSCARVGLQRLASR